MILKPNFGDVRVLVVRSVGVLLVPCMMHLRCRKMRSHTPRLPRWQDQAESTYRSRVYDAGTTVSLHGIAKVSIGLQELPLCMELSRPWSRLFAKVRVTGVPVYIVHRNLDICFTESPAYQVPRSINKEHAAISKGEQSVFDACTITLDPRARHPRRVSHSMPNIISWVLYSTSMLRLLHESCATKSADRCATSRCKLRRQRTTYCKAPRAAGRSGTPGYRA